jgi:hypothetical protein
MKKVEFIRTEIGADLIISFALQVGAGQIQSLTLLRSPKYDAYLEEGDRGVSIGDEARLDGESERLRSIKIRQKAITLVGSENEFVLNVEAVTPEELRSTRKVIKLMNYDSRFKIC